MPAVEINGQHYILCGQKYLRCGYTTGTCAALASKAAAISFFTQENVKSVQVLTPKGISVQVEVHDCVFNPTDSSSSAAVIKDAGDDCDVTNHCLVRSKLCFIKDDSKTLSIEITGGKGVGTVCLPGLEQAVGSAAINKVPRQMIKNELESLCKKYKFFGKVIATIEVPEGEELAKSTFNGQLGIKGGISILGTSGIVEPQSVQALLDALEVELKQISSLYKNKDGSLKEFRPVILTPGNYGTDFIAKYPRLKKVPVLKCSNFIGDCLDMCAAMNFTHVLLVGHAGKLVKLAAGIMNTHSRNADCRIELFALYASLCAAPLFLVQNLMTCITSSQCIEMLQNFDKNNNTSFFLKTMEQILLKIDFYLKRRAADTFKIEAVLFTNEHGIVGKTESAQELINLLELA